MTPLDASAASSIACLEGRIASIPEALARASTTPLPRPIRPVRTMVTTGIGASEGPARMLAHAALEAGIVARFVPLATFASADVVADLLVCFSQNLSPNARLALEPRHHFAARWLVTSVGLTNGASQRAQLLDTLAARGVVPIVVPPESEDGMLVRVVGPAVASLIALRIGALLGAPTLVEVDFSQAAAAYSPPCVVPALGHEGFALVGAGLPLELLHGHRWKLLETLLRGDPSVWDVLQIAHGPLQTFHERPMQLIVFETREAAPLVARLEATLIAGRHALLRIRARRTDALALVEHTAALDACLLTTLRASPLNLYEWPGRGADAPLYGLGET